MQNQNINLIVATLLSIAILFGWQYFFEKPRLAKTIEKQKTYSTSIAQIKESQKEDFAMLPREDALIRDKRIYFENPLIKGSINLKGLRIDDLTFLKYKETIDINSPNVHLLQPNKTKDSYFAEIGWISTNRDLALPGDDTIWSCKNSKIEVGKILSCSWSNDAGITFKSHISLDDKYMFNLKNEVINKSSKPISIQSYGIIYKTFNFEASRVSVVHEGGSGVFNEELKEFPYKDIKDKKKLSNKLSPVNWYGITDKYWLVALIPDKSINYITNASYLIKNAEDRYQLDFVSPSQIIEQDASFTLEHSLFAGAKELEILDKYEESMNIKLFDRTVDFGWFYIITKPLLWILHFFYDLVGNFGLSIMIVTVLVKLAMFQLANKSYKSMKVMKELQPEIERIKQRCGDDKLKMNQEVMNLYKKNNVNPLSGCLPIFIQIPVFFSLYKVLNVSIDMRQAPFYGWITDLSVADPTNIFNLFGLIPFDPPSFLHLGIWPILMGITMFLQQKMSPPPADPTQAQVMQMMPLIFLFMFSSMPAGLLIYWTWNNILSILQQYYINKSHGN